LEDEALHIIQATLRKKPLGDRLVDVSRPGVDFPDLRDRSDHEPIDL
jgi:hypothetical protein